MANRDKFQSPNFIYTNMYEVFKKAKNSKNADFSEKEFKSFASSDSSVFRVSGIEVKEYTPKNFSVEVKPQNQSENQAPTKSTTLRLASVNLEKNLKSNADGRPSLALAELRENMEKLQDLQSKLRFMIQELDELVNSKKD